MMLQSSSKGLSASEKKYYKARPGLVIESKLTLGYTVQIPKKVCFVHYAKNGGSHQQQLEVDKFQEVLPIRTQVKFHKSLQDAAIAARMAEQSASHGSVVEKMLLISAQEAEQECERNRSILLKLCKNIISPIQPIFSK